MSGNGGQAGFGVVDETANLNAEIKDVKTSQDSQKCEKKVSFSQVVYESGLVAAKTVAGVGIGAAVGIGAVVAIVTAEVTLPALLIIKTFGFAGGAVGFLKGLNKKRQ